VERATKPSVLQQVLTPISDIVAYFQYKTFFDLVAIIGNHIWGIYVGPFTGGNKAV
jgi:prophage maintenance system killer protein